MPSSKQEKIGEWSRYDLKRFIAHQAQFLPPNLPKSYTGNEVRAVEHLAVENTMELSPQAIAYLKTQLGL